MQVAGSSSWRLAESVEQMLHVVLYTRAALALPVQEDVDPPDLDVVDVPRVPAGEAAQDGLVTAWRLWWQDHLAQVLLLSGADLREAVDAPPWARTPELLRPDVDGAAWGVWVREVLGAHDVGHPPDFAGIADAGLRAAAVAAWPAARRWVDSGPCSPSSRRAHLAYDVVREVAEDVAFDRQVDPGRVSAAVLPLDVRGSWWRLWAPGVVLCSFDAAADPRASRVLLRAAFTSGL